MKNKRLLITLVGCLLPLAALVAIWVFKVPLGAVATFGLLLLCPLSHLFLMKGMNHKTHTAAAPSRTGSDKPACH